MHAMQQTSANRRGSSLTLPQPAKMPIHWTPVKIRGSESSDAGGLWKADLYRISHLASTWGIFKLQVVNPAPQGSTAGLYSLVPHTQCAQIYTLLSWKALKPSQCFCFCFLLPCTLLLGSSPTQPCWKNPWRRKPAATTAPRAAGGSFTS